MCMEENLTALVDAFDASWNAHDEEAILEWFTEGAVVSMCPAPPGQPDTYHGKEEIIGWVHQTLPGFHVESRSHGELGDTVTSDVTIATDSLPVESADATVATLFEGVRSGRCAASSSPRR